MDYKDRLIEELQERVTELEREQNTMVVNMLRLLCVCERHNDHQTVLKLARSSECPVCTKEKVEQLQKELERMNNNANY